MNKRTGKFAALLAASTLALSGAYTLGAQTDGSGIAAAVGSGSKDGRGGLARGPHGPRISALATKLGVSEADLRGAFEEMRSEQGPPGGDRDDRRARFADALSRELGVDSQRVEAALEKVRTARKAEHEKRRDERAATLARKLGISADRVEEAMESLRPDGRRGLGGPPRGAR